MITQGRKGHLRLVMTSVSRRSGKHDDRGTVFRAAESQDSGHHIAETRDFVFARGKRLAGGYELKGDLHTILSSSWAFVGTVRPTTPARIKSRRTSTVFTVFSFARFGVVAG